MRRALPLLCILATHLAVLGCATTPSEDKLIGTWVARASSTPDQLDTPPGRHDAVAKMIFKADHTFLTYRTDEPDVTRAVWSVEGNELVVRGNKIEDRVPIAKLTGTKLVILVGHEYSKSNWWRSGSF